MFYLSNSKNVDFECTQDIKVKKQVKKYFMECSEIKK